MSELSFRNSRSATFSCVECRGNDGPFVLGPCVSHCLSCFFCGVVGNGDFRASLQMKHGAAFTSKLETMITDRNMSFDLMNDFKKWSRSLTLPIREFQAFVRCVVGCFLFSPR